MSWSAPARNAMLGGLTNIIERIGLADPAGDEQTGGVYDGPFVPNWGISGGVATADPEDVAVNAGTLQWVLFMEVDTPDLIVHAMFPYMAGTTPPIIAPATVAASGNVFTSPAHGLSNGDRVAVYPVLGQSLPSGLSGPPTLYYVLGATTDTFQVETSPGSGAVSISADGYCWVHQGLPETFAAAGTSTVTASIDGRVV